MTGRRPSKFPPFSESGNTWIVAPEVVEKYGDLKGPETAIGTGPFTLERYERNVKASFRRNPLYFRSGQPSVDGVEWLIVEDESTGLATYRTGQIDAGPFTWWAVRQPDLGTLKKSRNDQPPFTVVRVRRAISRALDRQSIIESVWIRGEPSGAIGRFHHRERWFAALTDKQLRRGVLRSTRELEPAVLTSLRAERVHGVGEAPITQK